MQRTMSLAGLLLVGATLCAVGARYMTAGQIMTYHQQAMGLAWAEMSEGMRVMTLNFMRSAGGGFLAVGLTTIALAWFSRHAPVLHWSRWLAAGVPTLFMCLVLGCVVSVRLNTPAAPPLLPFFAALAVAAGSFALPVLTR